MCDFCDNGRTKDAERAYEILDLIDKNRHALDMSTWGARPGGVATAVRPITFEEVTADSCGTTACFAGWTVLAAGYGMRDMDALDADGNRVGTVAHVAAKFLGLGRTEACDLFWDTSGGSLHGRIKEIFGEDPRPR